MNGFTHIRLCRGFLTVAFLAGAAVLDAQEAKPADEQRLPIPITEIKQIVPVDFEKEILPILKNSCLACHNKTAAKGDLILETPAEMIKGGESGSAVMAGHGNDSLLLQAAAHQKKPMMPPRNNKVAAADLTSEHLGLIKLWIDQGAKGSLHQATPIEWEPLPDGLNPIYAVALTRDGQIAACGRANQIFIYSIPSGQLVTRLTDPQLLTKNRYGKPGAAHRDLVHSLAFNPEGSLLASGGYREVKIWRFSKDNQQLAFPFAARKTVQTVAVSPNGRWLATGGDDSLVTLWDLRTGNKLKTFGGHRGAISALRFSPDGGRLLSGSRDKSIRVWDLAWGKLFARIQTLAAVNTVTWLENGKEIAAGGEDQVIRIWQLPDSAGQQPMLEKELTGHQGAVTSLEPIPTAGKQLLSGSTDGTIRQWNVADGQIIRELKHGGPVASVAVRGDGKFFASAGLDNAARLWDAEKGERVAELKGDRYAREWVAEKERALAFATNEVAYRKTTFQNTTNQHNLQVERVKKGTDALAAAEKALTDKQKTVKETTEAKAAAEKALDELNTVVKKATEALEAAEKAASAVIDKSKIEAEVKGVTEKLAAGAKEKQKQATEKVSATAKPVEAAQMELKKAELTRSNAEHELQLANEAVKKAAEVMNEAQDEIPKAQTEQTRAELDLEAAKKAVADAEKPIRTIAFSPDNLAVATAGDDQLIHTWSAGTGAPFETLRGHRGTVFNLSYSSDGSLVSGAADRSAIVWNANPKWTLERVLGTGGVDSPLSDRVNAVRFSPDGRLLATGGGEPSRGGEIKIWNVATGQLQQDFKNVHSDTVFGLDFSPDGKYLASGAADKFVRVLEVASGKVVKSFEGHTHHVLGVSWKRDGRTLISCGADNVLKVWDFLTGERKKTIEGFGKEVTSISFIGITDQALATSGDSKVRLVQDNGTEVRSFVGASDFVFSAAATPDGKIVIAGGEDSILRIWNGSDGKTIATFEPPKSSSADAQARVKN
ncbi:MAG: c-type cytochrome domain-containing protein [Verrucomicrobiota bacterium]